MLRAAGEKIFNDRHTASCFVFFSLTLIIGLLTFRQYGLSWDEPVQRQLGLATWDYVTGERDTLHQMINQYHNPGFELIEILPEKLFQLKSGKAIYDSRHLLNYLIFWMGSIFFYLLARRILKSRWLALIAVLILYLTPRIYAHAFYNSKDIPLLVFFTISSYCVLKFFGRISYRTAFVLAVASGFLFGIRIVGALIPLFVVIFFLLNLYVKNLSQRDIKYLIVYLLTFCCFAYICYPVIWNDPVGQLITAFHMMSHFPFDDKVLFMGRLLYPQQIPWYYVPVWMGITIPLCWQAAFVMGIAVIVIMISFSKQKLKSDWPLLFVLAWCVVPWLLVLLLNTPLYDEWRHLFFIYPAFVLIAVYGIKTLFERKGQPLIRRNILQFLFIAGFSIQTISTVVFMTRNHPYQFVYFNALAGKDVGRNFDLDYWGLSYRAAFSYLLQSDSENPLKVCWANNPGQYNLVWFSDGERKRLLHVSFDSCTYFFTNFRFHPEQYTDSAWHAVRVNNFTILAIEKIH